MLDDVIRAINENAEQLDRKASYFRWGYRVLALGLIVAFVLAFLD